MVCQDGVLLGPPLARLDASAVLALGADSLGVETEPMHPTHISRMLDLDAAIHDDLHPSGFGDGNTFRADHAKLQPMQTWN